MTDRLASFEHDGLTFRARDDGPADGPAVIALHGFPQLSSAWDPVTHRLVAAGFRVLRFDQRGYSPGARPQAPAAYRIDRLAGDVLALADAAGLDRFHLAGHDWGGGVAWYTAARHPERLLSLTAVSTPHPRALIGAMRHGQALKSWYMGVFMLPKVPEKLFARRGGHAVAESLRSSGVRDPASSAALLADPESATGLFNWYRAMRVPGAPPPGKVSVPTLYVWGDADFALGPWAAVNTGHWVNGPYELQILYGASHWILDRHPDELADLMIPHLLRWPSFGEGGS